jgi:fucose 4-O-acetylase-like acetyltransferase
VANARVTIGGRAGLPALEGCGGPGDAETVTATTPDPGRGHPPAAHGPALGRWASGRRLYLDNLKVALVSVVIAGHAVVGYSAFDWWSYSDVRESTLAPVTVVVLLMFAIPFGMVVIPLLFLVAGLLTPPSVERRGPAGYARERLLRLGVPFAVVALLLWPYLEYLLFHVLGETDVSYAEYLRREGTLDTGVLWFVAALLVFSLAYAGAVRLLRGRAHRAEPREIRAAHLAGVALAVAVATFLVRLLLPYETDSRYVDVNLWAWPAGAALFGIGVAASRLGWAESVPERLRRRSGAVTLVAAGAAAAFMGVVAIAGIEEERLAGGRHWPAVLFVTGESVIAVFGAVWLLGVAQRRLDRTLRGVTPAVARGAYGAFLLQGPVLLAIAVALRGVPAPAEAKALVTAAAGVAGSYALAWLLIRHAPLADRVL